MEEETRRIAPCGAWEAQRKERKGWSGTKKQEGRRWDAVRLSTRRWWDFWRAKETYIESWRVTLRRGQVQKNFRKCYHMQLNEFLSIIMPSKKPLANISLARGFWSQTQCSFCSFLQEEARPCFAQVSCLLIYLHACFPHRAGIRAGEFALALFCLLHLAEVRVRPDGWPSNLHWRTLTFPFHTVMALAYGI